MANFANGKIQAFAGPTELGAPDDLEEVILDFINGANKTLDMAVQELDSKPIAQAILDARCRGVRVRLVMEQDYLARRELPPIPPPPSIPPDDDDLPLTVNREILRALLLYAVDVKADFNPKIFHQKFIIRDKSKKETRAVLTGSTNFTHTGTHKNLNHIVIFHDKSICKAYQAEFDEIRSGTFGALNPRHWDKPKTFNIEGVPVRILFAPDDAPELEIIKQMLKCNSRLDFAIFTFSGSSGIDDAMTILRAAGRELRGVFDPGQGRMWWAASHWLHDKGIAVYLPREVEGFGKLHHKLMVIDEAIVIGGSMNYTAPANEYNDENIFVIGNPYDLPEGKGGPVDHDACAEIARYFRGEIERIIDTSDLYQTG